MSLYNDLIFTEAIEQVGALVDSQNPDEIATRLEQLAANQDLAHACMFLLLLRAKGIDTSGMTGIDLARTQPTVHDLILPPGVIQ